MFICGSSPPIGRHLSIAPKEPEPRRWKEDGGIEANTIPRTDGWNGRVSVCGMNHVARIRRVRSGEEIEFWAFERSDCVSASSKHMTGSA